MRVLEENARLQNKQVIIAKSRSGEGETEDTEDYCQNLLGARTQCIADRWQLQQIPFGEKNKRWQKPHKLIEVLSCCGYQSWLPRGQMQMEDVPSDPSFKSYVLNAQKIANINTTPTGALL